MARADDIAIAEATAVGWTMLEPVIASTDRSVSSASYV